MTGPKLLRDITNRMLDAVLLAIGQEARGGAISQESVNSIFERFMNAPDYLAFYTDAYQDIAADVSRARLDCRRVDPFGRLMVQPLIGLFDEEAFEREILPNLFNFYHLVLGDDEGLLRQECKSILEEVRSQSAAQFRWDFYYQDEKATHIYWQIIVRIANLFKRWDLRKDWFLKLMQYSPHTTSLGPQAFQVLEPSSHGAAAPMVFGEPEFKKMLHAYCDGVRAFSPGEKAAFIEDFGEPALSSIEAILNKV